MPLSRGVGVDDDTVRRWMTGRTVLTADHGVLNDALALLARRRVEFETEARERLAAIDAATDALRHWLDIHR